MMTDLATSRNAIEENVVAALAVFRSVGLLVSASHPEQL
jgi:hypothetical protein